MIRRISLAFALGSVAGFVLVAPSGAYAATTIGQTFVPEFSCSPVVPTEVRWQDATSPGMPSYVVPAGGGVITSWSTNPGPHSGTTTRLEVVNAAGTAVVGESAMQTNIPANVATSFPTNIPVQAGDKIGLELNTPNEPWCGKGAVVGGNVNNHSADPGPGASFTGSVGSYATYLMNVSAVVSPLTTPPTASPPTGQRSAALKKCRKKHSKKARKNCRKKAKKLPV